MFAARGGFLGQYVVPPPPAPDWQDITGSDIAPVVSTWDLTGSRSYTTYNVGSSIWSTNLAYAGFVAHPNGKIYGAPALKQTNNILEFDPVTGSSQEIATGQSLTGGLRFICGNLGSDNRIYWWPFNMDKAMIFDPDTNSFELQNWGLTFSNPAYELGMVAGDKMYVIGTPSTALVYNVTANTATTSSLGLGTLGTNGAKWVSGVRSIENEKLYAAPYNTGGPSNNRSILIIDPATDTAEVQTYGFAFGTQASQGITNAKNGNLYMTGHTTTTVFTLDPSANTMVSLGNGTKVMGATMGPDGNVYCGPWTTGMWIDVDTNTKFTNPTTVMPSGANRWGCLNQGNLMVQMPNATSNTHAVVITVDGTGSTDANVGLYSWTGYFNRDR